MFIRRKQLTKTSLNDKDDEGIIPQTAPGIAAPERGCEAVLQAEQRIDHHTAPLPSSEKECRVRRSRLAELQQTAAALIAELNLEAPAAEFGVLEP
ncbi:unnamed protein product [Lampetra fluviatilis]